MTDISETIARVNEELRRNTFWPRISGADVARLISAAEAGIAARDAALKEAAAVCIKYSKAFDRTIAKADAATTCATRIRALRSKP